MAHLMVVLLLCGPISAADAAMAKVGMHTGARTKALANPIRKVVTMLQMMDKKIRAEGDTAKELFDKFMCYCENADTILGKSISEAEAKIPQLESSIKESVEMKKQLEAEIEKHQKDRKEIESAMSKQLAVFKSDEKQTGVEQEDLKGNIASLEKAVAALEKGVAGSFLQTKAASALRQLSISMDLGDTDRSMLASFLSDTSGSGYTPQSQEIIGILKQMLDEMRQNLRDEVDTFHSKEVDYKEFYKINIKRITTIGEALEAKLTRVGELGVQIAMLKNDLEDTEEGLKQDSGFLGDLDKNCKLKKTEWATYQKMMQEELLALADTIKILNDDDTLELMKKAVPSAASLLQVTATTAMLRSQALVALRVKRGDPRLGLLEMALQGKKMGFDSIIGMIDKLVADLGKEQKDDDAKKEWCLAELDASEDDVKGLSKTISDIEAAVDDEEEEMATLKSEIEALSDGIRELDKQVAAATEQRKEENEDFQANLASNSAAVEILEFAKNRLNKFYNPKLYKAPAKRELTEEERITINNGGTLAPTEAPGGIAGTGIAVFAQVAVRREEVQLEDAPAPPPEADLSYKKGGESSSGVIAMIDNLIADVQKDIATMKVNEKDAQADYEGFIKDSATKRAEDSKAITDKEGSLAELEGELLANKKALKGKQYDLMDVEKYAVEIHQQCDWLLKNYDLRKMARADEVDALGKAKDVLNGADYSL